MSELDREIDHFFAEGRVEVQHFFDDLGQRARDLNIAEGDYNNVTGHLRASNYYEASPDELELGNHASYASNVESRGRNVIDSGVKLIMEELNDNI